MGTKKQVELLKKVDKNGKETIVVNAENVSRILLQHDIFAGNLRFDAFRNRYQIKEKNEWRNIIDDDFISLQRKLQREFSFFTGVSKMMVTDAVISACKENEVDTAKEYIEALVWDKQPRVDDWLHHTYGVEKTKVNASIASNWIKGLVNRAINPGCRFDYVLVLIGTQGTRKSTSLNALAGNDWHLETDGRIDKDFLQDMEGKLVVEFSEGETLNRTETTKLKAFITKTQDTYRESYGRISKDHPRRCVFAMTTNDHEFLKDATGNRRWLPVEIVQEADVEWIIENREQMFAEAYYRLNKKKETTWEFPQSITFLQEARRIHDPDELRIVEWYLEINRTRRELGVSLHQAYIAVFEPANEKAPIPWSVAKTLTNTFRHVIKLDNHNKRDENNTVRKYWFPTSKTPPPSPTATMYLSIKETDELSMNEFTGDYDYDDDEI